MSAPVFCLGLAGQGHLLAGGAFTNAGGMAASHVALWDGAAWSPLGLGLDAPVWTLAVASNRIYAGGQFVHSGGIEARRVASWNGVEWSPLGVGMDSYVKALAVDGAGQLYAGGGFTTAGGVVVNHIAKWNGQAWSPLGGGVNAPVYALAFGRDGSLYAGGAFTMAGGESARYIARWDGRQWSPLGTGLDAAPLALVMDPSSNVLYAGGGFSAAGPRAVSHVARWNGQAWSSLGLGTQGGGRSGNGWVRALWLGTNRQLYAGGHFATAGGLYVNSIARADLRDGQHWPSLGETLGYPSRSWSTGGDALWFPDPRSPSSTIVRSGALLDNQVSWLRVTLEGPGTLRFKWRPDCQIVPGEGLWFFIDGREQGHTAGGGWTWDSQYFTLSPGSHGLEWVRAA
jgi:hypothetical protein